MCCFIFLFFGKTYKTFVLVRYGATRRICDVTFSTPSNIRICNGFSFEIFSNCMNDNAVLVRFFIWYYIQPGRKFFWLLFYSRTETTENKITCWFAITHVIACSDDNNHLAYGQRWRMQQQCLIIKLQWAYWNVPNRHAHFQLHTGEEMKIYRNIKKNINATISVIYQCNHVMIIFI